MYGQDFPGHELSGAVALPSIGFTQRRPDSVDLQVIQRPRETRIQSTPPLGRLCASPLGAVGAPWFHGHGVGTVV